MFPRGDKRNSGAEKRAAKLFLKAYLLFPLSPRLFALVPTALNVLNAKNTVSPEYGIHSRHALLYHAKVQIQDYILTNDLHFSFLAGKCVITADGASLGAPACKGSQNIYLKTVYACVNRDVFKPAYRVLGDPTTTTTTTTTTSTTAPPYVDYEHWRTTDPPIVITDDHMGSLDDPARDIKAETMLGDLSHARTPDEHHQEDGRGRSQDATVSSTATDSAGVTEKETDLVVGFVSDFMSSYNHIKQHQAKFILFASLSVALGLALFLSMLVWGMYRSARLSRIKNSVQTPAISTYYTPTSPSNSSLTGPPAGAIDIELEVGDHEVDTAFRDPIPDPLIVARPSSPAQYYGTLKGRSSRDHCESGGIPASTSSSYLVQHTCDNNGTYGQFGHADPARPQPAWAKALNAAAPTSILRNSSSRDSPMSGSGSEAGLPAKQVRYSTLGHPGQGRSPTHGILVNGRTHQRRGERDGSESGSLIQGDSAPPRSLTLSRLSSSNADHLLYG